MNFFATLNYSSANEDGLTELKALDISKSDRVGCNYREWGPCFTYAYRKPLSCLCL